MEDSLLYYGNPNYVKGVDYTQITLDKLGFTVDAIKQQLQGINADIIDPLTGEPYPDSLYQSLMYQAVAEAEKQFDIVIRPRLVADRSDYYRNNYNSFMFLHTNNRPILHVENIQLKFNNMPIINYPDEWIKVENRVGQLQIQPSILMQSYIGTMSPTIAFPVMNPYGYTPDNYCNHEFAPQMIGVKYVAGMIPQTEENAGITTDVTPPPDLIAYTAKLGAIEILERWGRSIIGAGIAGQSVSIDGISTSIQTTASAENTATTADIDLMKKDMEHIKNGLLSYYGDRNFGIIA